jgi:hypothetical protein
MKNPLTVRGWLIVGVVILILALIGFAVVQTNRLRRIEVEKRAQEYRQEQIRIEKEYIPAALDKKTTDELSKMGGVLWGE